MSMSREDYEYGEFNPRGLAEVSDRVSSLEDMSIITTEDLAAALAGFSVVLLGALEPQQQEAVLSRLKPGLRRIAARFEKSLAADALEMAADMIEESDGDEGD